MDFLESVFNHLVLPPKLPGRQDVDTEDIQHNLLSRLIRACDTLKRFTGRESRETWASVHHSLLICLKTNRGRLEKASMLEELPKLPRNGIIILHVVEQNAALLIRHRAE